MSEPKNDNKQTIVVVTSVYTLITTIIGMVTFGVKFNDRLYASKEDVSRVEKQVMLVSEKMNYLLRSGVPIQQVYSGYSASEPDAVPDTRGSGRRTR